MPLAKVVKASRIHIKLRDSNRNFLGVKKNPVVPGSILEEDILFECKKFNFIMLTQEFVSPNKNSYITNCDCRGTILEANITSGSQAMIQFFTLSQTYKRSTLEFLFDDKYR